MGRNLYTAVIAFFVPFTVLCVLKMWTTGLVVIKETHSAATVIVPINIAITAMAGYVIVLALYVLRLAWQQSR